MAPSPDERKTPSLSQLARDASPKSPPTSSRKRRAALDFVYSKSPKLPRSFEAPSQISVPTHASAVSSVSRASVPVPGSSSNHPEETTRSGSDVPDPTPNTNPVKTNVTETTDRLGTLLAKCSAMLEASSSWEDFVHQVHGPSSLQDNMQDLPHPAGEFLASLHEHGVPCKQSDPDWSLELLDE